jgi:hypothetical protein
MSAAPDLFGAVPQRRAPSADLMRDAHQPRNANGAWSCPFDGCGADASFGFRCEPGQPQMGLWLCGAHRQHGDRWGRP